MTYIHVPVLLENSLQYLITKPDGVYVDCTLGTGGHFSGIGGRLSPGAFLIGLDADPTAIEHCRASLSIPQKYILETSNFSNLKRICFRAGFPKVTGILFDLGMSSFALDNPQRGFSFNSNGPLDMRFSPEIPVSAGDFINSSSVETMTKTFWNYGEERSAKRIARAIEFARAQKPIETTAELANIVVKSAHSSFPNKTLSRIFQAIRIQVNQELEVLESALQQAIEILEPNGRLVVISYHSLEDRIVKIFMKRESTDCICPPDFPICQCQHHASAEILTRKPVEPSDAEIKSNSRARSARLRALRKKEPDEG
ncbi:MAG: 16S rRNA (cytosine(1402)-N(4))-methyltransferase RsmH [Candidatus Neomarinimicrobiota bacterium]